MRTYRVTNTNGDAVEVGGRLTDVRGGEARLLSVKVSAAGYMVEVKRSHALYTETRFAAFFGLRVEEKGEIK